MPNRISSVVICDEIRQEITGKEILIGVYSGGINVSAYPAMLRVGLWLEFSQDDAGTTKWEIKIESPSGNPPGTIGFEMDYLGPVPSSSSFVVNGILLALERDGEIVISSKKDDGDWEVIKRKSVVRVPPPS